LSDIPTIRYDAELFHERRLRSVTANTRQDGTEFLEQIADSGGHLWACKMSADMQGLEQDELDDRVEGILSASDFIEKTAGAQLLFI
jgi:peroxiredoxin family protein